MITFHERTPMVIVVKLDNRKVGEIRRIGAGWQYRAMGSKVMSEVFKSLNQLKTSLMAEES